MTPRVQVHLNVPISAIDPFLEWVVEKHGEEEPYAMWEFDEAVREFLDDDVAADADEKLREWKDFAGHSRGNRGNKIPRGPTREVKRTLNPDLKKRLSKETQRLNDERDQWQDRIWDGQVFALALNERRGGGRARRMAENIDTLDDAVRGALSQVYGDGGEKLTVRAKRRQQIRQGLNEEFTHEELVSQIRSVAGESKSTVQKYVADLKGEMDIAEHPETRDSDDATIYVPSDEAERIARELAEERKHEAEERADDDFDSLEAADCTSLLDANCERSDEGNSGDDIPSLSAAQRRIIAELGADPANPEHVQACLTDDGRDIDDITDAVDGDDRDSEETEPEVVTDGGSSDSELPMVEPSPASQTSGPIPRLRCPCCGALVPLVDEPRIRDDQPVKDCRRCRYPVDLLEAIDAAVVTSASGDSD